MRKFMTFFICAGVVSLFGCTQETFSTVDILADAADAGMPAYDNHDSFELSLGSYRDSAIVKYCVISYPPLMGSVEANAAIRQAADLWANTIEKPLKRGG